MRQVELSRRVHLFAVWPLAMLLGVVAGCGSRITTPILPAGDTVAPTVTATAPVNGAIGVGIISANFSEAMDVSSITAISFSIRGPGSMPVTGTVAYAATNDMAVFTPTVALSSGTLYTATISTAVADVAGNALANNHVWTFTTRTSGGGSDGRDELRLMSRTP